MCSTEELQWLQKHLLDMYDIHVTGFDIRSGCWLSKRGSESCTVLLCSPPSPYGYIKSSLRVRKNKSSKLKYIRQQNRCEEEVLIIRPSLKKTVSVSIILDPLLYVKMHSAYRKENVSSLIGRIYLHQYSWLKIPRPLHYICFFV